MHSPQLEWVTTRQTLVPLRIPRKRRENARREKKGMRRDDWSIAIKGRSCGWKTQNLKPPCNDYLIIHKEGSIRSHIGPSLDT